MPQNKTVKATGKANVTIDGDKLVINQEGSGLISVMVGDGDGAVAYMYHPLSGWYVEMDLRRGKVEGEMSE